MQPSKENCENCPAHNYGNLVKLGIDMQEYDYVVALAGNPNTGKSTVFNNLTGLRQHTGNWPGKTVTRAEGGFEYNSNKYKLVDLPGTYSLLSTSSDEEIARDFILFGQPDVTIVVVDATRLERNLNLLLQIREITNRVVVCLNLMDEAKRRNINVNPRLLAKKLGVPVISAEARQRVGMQELISMIDEIATGKTIGADFKLEHKNEKLRNSIESLSNEISESFPDLPNTRWVALRLLEGDQNIIDAVRSGDLANLVQKQQETQLATGDDF